MPDRDDSDPRDDEVAELRRQLDTQQRIAYAAGLLGGDVTVRTLLESLAEGVLIVDEDGTIVMVNEQLGRMLGYAGDELKGQNVRVLVPEYARPRHTTHVRAYFDHPRIRAMGRGVDLTALHQNGSEVPVEISLSHLPTDRGRLALAFVTDITLRRRAEAELRARSQELDDFASTVAHDLRSTSRRMGSFSRLLLEPGRSLSTAESRDALQRIASNAEKMSNTISELLLFARMRKDEVEPVVIDVGECARNALERIDLLIGQRGARLEVSEAMPPALGHASWVEEIWLNLLTNAIEHGGKPPTVAIGGEQRGDTSQYWVKDNGAGPPPEVQEAYNRREDITRCGSEGACLGLNIVRRIVEKLGGNTAVSRGASMGTTFSFSLPRPASS